MPQSTLAIERTNSLLCKYTNYTAQDIPIVRIANDLKETIIMHETFEKLILNDHTHVRCRY